MARVTFFASPREWLLASALSAFALSGCGGGGGTSGQPSKRCPQLRYAAKEIARPNIPGVGSIPDEVYNACAQAESAAARVRDACGDEEIDAFVVCEWDEQPSNALLQGGGSKEFCPEILASREDSPTVRFALSKAGVTCFISIPNLP
jgi:hypothetical protein